MLSSALRQRLEAINREALPEPALRIAPHTLPDAEVAGEQAAPAPWTFDPLAGGTVETNSSGEHLRIRLPLANIWSNCNGHIAHAAERWRAAKAEQPLHADLTALVESFPERALFLDLETCGFAGSAIFLIGLVRQHEGELILEQLLARNYAEERAMLETLWRVAAENDTLATYNGKSFDWPMVQDRSTLHHLGCQRRPKPTTLFMAQQTKPTTKDSPRSNALPLGRRDPRPELRHVDLLHHARRQWRRRLPNCKLQTLEQFICGRRRMADISGAKIPAAYHDYVRTGQTDAMRSILHHNLLDLVTLVEVFLRLTSG